MKKYESAEWLQKKYVEEGLTQKEISNIVGCHYNTIRRKLNEYSISKEKIGKTKHICEYCKENFMAEPSKNQKYCSKDCTAEAFSDRYSGEGGTRWKGGKITKSCNICDTNFKVKPARKDTAKYCSRDCMGKSKETDNPEIKYYGGWERKRKFALQRDNHKCQVCGMSKEEHVEKYGRSLDVHHLKPIKEFDNPKDAHYLGNLITVCRKHHSVIEDWGLKPSNA